MFDSIRGDIRGNSRQTKVFEVSFISLQCPSVDPAGQQICNYFFPNTMNVLYTVPRERYMGDLDIQIVWRKEKDYTHLN